MIYMMQPTTSPAAETLAAVAAEGPDLSSYSTIVVAFSGGKDSLACLLHLLESGVERDRIELWHHDVDGREGSELMDWRCTRSYCERVAEALGVRIFFSWKVGGFEREMLREGTATAPTRFELPDGSVAESGGRGKPGTRLKFPQKAADLSVRWCSAYLKIDVGASALRNQARFENTRTLVVSGERAEESSARAKYRGFEPDRADRRGSTAGPRLRCGRSSSAGASTRTRRTASAGAACHAPPASSAAPISGRAWLP
jgi:3'-phosphoadenosine 5'-phosphosulfate sulfotransferase (PAPS reductase)/FAD synthetase